ncbi:MAG: hypothetical protein DRI93_04425 [Aquificota bacterium]|nr:MAG: hypothetical protein DRI93_04425 [Aquificota bacterium]
MIPYVCPRCKREFKTASALREHYKTHRWHR